eukprot:3306921-Alexandrium_andersonii.AAC.1
MAARPRARQAASPTKAKPAPPCCRGSPRFRAARRENAAPPSQAPPVCRPQAAYETSAMRGSIWP